MKYVWELHLGERGLICGADSESKYLPWLCSEAELGFLSPFYLPWGRRRLEALLLRFDAAAQGCSEKAQGKEVGQPRDDQGAARAVRVAIQISVPPSYFSEAWKWLSVIWTYTYTKTSWM